jgi:hypothetical protein
MLSQSPAPISGSDSQATLGEKKVACTRGHPGALVTTR